MDLQSFNNYCQNLMTEGSDKIFFHSHEKTLTYKSFLQNASALASHLDLLKENFLALKLTHADVMFTYVFAAMMSGKKILLLSAKEPEHLSQKHRKHIPYEYLINDHCPLNFEHANIPSPHNFKISFERPFLFVLSSGSSGEPKGVGHSLSTLTHSSLSLIKALSMQEGERTFLTLPHFHVGGLMTLWRAFLSRGIVDTTGENYDYLSLVPLQLQRTLSNPSELFRLKNAKALLIGGSLLSPDLKMKAQDNHLPIFETYGMTETCSLIMLNGFPLEGQEVKLDSEQTILIKGPTLSPGFYKDGHFQKLPLTPDFFYQTSDRGERTLEGSIRFVERKDILFKSGGELINPLIIENTVRELEWIRDCVVVPLPHEEWGQAACLLYETSEGSLDEYSANEKIHSFLKLHLHPYLIPKFLFAFPLTLTGLKPGRHDLTKAAYTLLLKKIFSFDFFLSQEKQKTLWVFFHGFMGNKKDFNNVFELMKKSSSTSYLFLDLPGHGETLTTPFTSRADAFIKIKDLINSFKNDGDLIFYGYSMGGRIALELSLDSLSPQKLFLESASFGLSNEEEKTERLIADKNLFKSSHFNTKDFLLSWYSSPMFAGYSQSADFQSELEFKSHHNYQEWDKALDFFSPGKGSLLHETLTTLKAKPISLIVISGHKDKKYQEHFTFVQKELPFKRYDLKEASHNPHKTHPAEIAAILDSYSPPA